VLLAACWVSVKGGYCKTLSRFVESDKYEEIQAAIEGDDLNSLEDPLRLLVEKIKK
jgi:hypothetical protein